jgi:protein-disulfide isomerase
VRGEGTEAILYLDFACPHCAAAWLEIRALALRICFRHFPMTSQRPRSAALHAASEAAAGQDRFWDFCDSLFAERGRVDDPHLWERAERFGLEVHRFEADRRSDAVAARVRRDFETGIRGGVTGTPTAFAGGELVSDEVVERLAALT